jgi:hypothetical protein
MIGHSRILWGGQAGFGEQQREGEGWFSMSTLKNTSQNPSPTRDDYVVYSPSYVRLLHGIRLNYRQCPDCGKTWAPLLSNAKVIRVGREVFTCNCGSGWATGYVEWTHLSPSQKHSYFFSEAEIGVAAISFLVPPFFGYFIAENPWQGVLAGAKWGAIVGGAFVALLWTIKCCIVALSLHRCPPAISESKSLFPWEW